MIEINDFNKIDMRIGTIIKADVNKTARKPAYKLSIDLGELGIKKTSAQITDLYTTNELIGRQVIVVANFTPMHIGDIKSEVLILGTDLDKKVVLLNVDRIIPNGSKIY